MILRLTPDGRITDGLLTYTVEEARAKRDHADAMAAKLDDARRDCLETARAWEAAILDANQTQRRAA